MEYVCQYNKNRKTKTKGSQKEVFEFRKAEQGHICVLRLIQYKNSKHT